MRVFGSHADRRRTDDLYTEIHRKFVSIEKLAASIIVLLMALEAQLCEWTVISVWLQLMGSHDPE